MSDITYKYKTQPESAVDIYNRIKAESAYRKQQKAQQEAERQALAYAQQQEAAALQEQAQQKAQEEQKNKGGFLGGLGYVGEQIGLGLLRGIEGIWDFAAGGIADLFGADEWAEKQVSNDWVNYNHANEWYNPGTGWEFAGQVGQGVGQMLPSIAVTAATGGAGAPAALSSALGTGVFMAGAAGNSVADAYRTTGELGAKEWLYGTGSGILEGAIEKVSGGIGGTKLGTVLGKKVANSTAGKLATSFVGEGLEEVASDLIDPTLRRVTGVDPNAQVDVSQLPNTFLVGGTTGAVLGGASRVANAKRAGGFNNLNAADAAQEIRSAQAKGDSLQAKGKLTESWAKTLGEKQAETAVKLSERLKKMTPESRSALIENNNLSYLFNEDGSMKEAPKATYNKDAYSYSLQGREDALKYQPTTQALTDTQKAVVRNVEKMSGGKVKTVIAENLTADDGRKANALYKDGVMYIDRNANAAEVEAVHEMTHSLEGTEAYNKYANFIFREIQSSPELTKRYGEYLSRYQATAEAYSGQTQNMGAQRARYVVQTELVSQYTADMFGNEEFIRRLSKSEPNVAQRLWQWIKDKIKVLTTKGGDRETVAFLQKAEKLYRKALSDSVGGVKLSELQFEDEAETDNASPARATPAEARFSVQTIDGKRIVVIDTAQDIFEGVPRSEYGKVVRQYMKEHFRGETIDGVKFNKRSENEYTRSEYTKAVYGKEPLYDAKMRAATELGNLVKTSKFLQHETAKHPHNYNVNGYNRYATQFILDGKTFSGEMLVALNDNGGAFYDIVKIKESGSTNREVPKSVDSASDESIAQNSAPVNSVRKKSGKSEDTRYSLNDKVEEEVLKHYGTTWRWAETGYLLKDGRKLDLSGRKEGAPGGYRALDHRDIFDIFEDGDTFGTDALVEFMGRGNIRVSPENPGINIQVEPTEAQYKMIKNMVETVGWQEKEFTVDFDNEKGNVVESLHYEGNMPSQKVVDDIQYYFKNGKLPHKSDLSDFRYSLPVKDKQNTLAESDFEQVLDHVDEFETVEEIKLYFERVHETINSEEIGSVRTMRELTEKENRRIEKVIKAANLEKEAIKAFRKAHKTKPTVDLSTKAKIEEVDRQYTEAIAKNDLETARYLVEQMALLKGYSVTDYRIDHQAPYNNGHDASLDDVSPMFGEDIYGSHAAQYFGTFEGFDGESIQHIQTAQGKPERYVTIYRAVPVSVKSDQIRNGDWITLTRQYAEQHGKSNIIGRYRVISKQVKAKNIYTDGNSIHEFGYDDGNKYYYRDTTNYRKLADVITFDDEGNPIRLKDRFNYRNEDVRYSLPIKDSEGRELTPEQREFFRDSKVVDENGKLRPVYHGTLSQEVRETWNAESNSFDVTRRDFTVFKRSADDENIGFFFASDYDNAGGYGSKVYSVYLNLTSPLVIDCNNADYSEIGYDGQVKDTYDWAKWAKKKGYDGVIFKNIRDGVGYEYMQQSLDEYVAFKSNQIKLTTNKTPTSDADIRYSLKKEPPKSKTAIETEQVISQISDQLQLDFGASKAEIKDLLSVIRGDVQEAFGKKNMREGSYRALYSKYKEKYYQKIRDNRATNQILDAARKARDMLNRKDYVSAGVLENDQMKDFLRAVSGFKRGANISGDIRQKIAALSDIYNENNLLLGGEDMNLLGDFDQDVADAIALMKVNSDSKKALSSEELQALKVISRGLVHLYQNYDKVFRDGKTQTAEKLATEAVTRGKKALRYRRKDGFLSSVFGKIGEGLRQITDPTSVARGLDGYDPDGFLTTALDEVKAGEVKAGVAAVDLMLPFEEFFKQNKGYQKRLEKEEMAIDSVVRVTPDGEQNAQELKLTVDEAMTLYLTSKRAQANIFESGITVERGGRTETYRIAEKDIEKLYELFTETDKKFAELAHEFFNEHARRLKVETDQALYGYAKVEDTNDYIPIRRDPGTIAKSLGDERGFVNEVANTRNFSFNKATRRGAKNKVYIGALTDLVTRHATEVSTYYGLAVPLKNFNKVYNRQVTVDGRKTSYRELLKNELWKGGEQYFRKLFNDVQGVRGQQTAADRALRQLRSVYSTYQLGANPKTVLSQTASYVMALTYLDADTLARGGVMKTDVEAMYKYAPITYQRMHDRAVVRAQGLMEKVGKVGNIATKPIQLMDNAVVHKLWNASQLQVEKDMGYQVGSEENLTEAGKLLDKVVRETQSNSLIAERSAMNRSQNFLASSLTMFMSDATKQVSRIADAVGEVRMLRAQLKAGEDVGERYAAAKKKLRKTLTGVLASNLHLALLALFFRWLYDKEEKDKDGNKIGFGASLAKEYASNLFGLIPIVRDIYGYLADDFEVNNYALSMINDLASAAKSMTGLVGDAISGKPLNTQEVMKPLRQMIYAVGQVTGIPVRNVYNFSYGLLTKFSPETAYRTNTLFYSNTGYAKDIKEALEQGNKDIARTIARTEIGLRGASGKVADEIARLYIAGESVMPKKTVEQVTIDGEQVPLTNVQMKAFDSAYKAYLPAVEKLMGSSDYRDLDDAGKAKAIGFIEEYYYAQAVESVLKISRLTAKQQATAIIPADKLAVYLAVISSIGSDKDKDGNTITGSRKKKVFAYINKLPISAAQKYVLMGLAGYKNEKGQSQVESLIRSKVKDRNTATALLEASGY